MGANPIISVILPVYKVEAYLPRCIDSILNQSFTDFELILVDDGSPDNCGIICDEYEKKDTRIHVIHQENARLSAARNVGINIASGEWIALVDADDWLHKDYLKALLSGVLKDTDVVICGSLVTSNDYEEDKEYPNIAFRSATMRDISSYRTARTRVWGRLIRRNTLGDLRFIPGTEPAEDSAFNALLFHRDMKFRITDTKLYYYYMRPDSTIHSHKGRGTLNAVRPLIEKLQETSDKERRRNIIIRCYKYIFSARYGEMYAEDYAEVKNQCTDLLRELSAYLPELKAKDRIVMCLFSKSPLLYRTWRIIDDHTLLKYEKNQRKKYNCQGDQQ